MAAGGAHRLIDEFAENRDFAVDPDRGTAGGGDCRESDIVM